jgi:hypothetical protein
MKIPFVNWSHFAHDTGLEGIIVFLALPVYIDFMRFVLLLLTGRAEATLEIRSFAALEQILSDFVEALLRAGCSRHITSDPPDLCMLRIWTNACDH